MTDDSSPSERAPVDGLEELVNFRRTIEQQLFAIRTKLDDCKRRIDSGVSIAELLAIANEASQLKVEAAQLRLMRRQKLGASLN